MSAKFPPNTGLQGSRKQCKTIKVTNHELLLLFLSSCHEAFVKLVAERRFGRVKGVRTARGMQSNKAVAFSSTVVTVITIRELIV